MLDELLKHNYRRKMFSLIESYICFGIEGTNSERNSCINYCLVGFSDTPSEDLTISLQGAFSQFFRLFGDRNFEMLGNALETNIFPKTGIYNPGFSRLF